MLTLNLRTHEHLQDSVIIVKNVSEFPHGNVKVSLNVIFYNENCLIPKIPPTPLFQRGELQSPPLIKGDLGGFLRLKNVR